MTVSFIIATKGRDTLQRTLDSIELFSGDEILVVGEQGVQTAFAPAPQTRFLECPRGYDWGHSERNFAMPQARGNFLSFMDDDDVYIAGHREAMQRAMTSHPDLPTIFRMRLNHMAGTLLWSEPEIRGGNVGTPMFFVPNDLAKLGSWPPVYGGDCTFIQECKWTPDEYFWATDVVADVFGHHCGDNS